MAKRLAVAGIVALVVALAAPVGGAAVTDGVGQEGIDPDGVVLDAGLQPNGDAVWTVEYRVRLATDNETAAFEEIRAAIRANESQYTSRFRDRMAGTAANAANATGREMAVENVTVSAETQALPQEYGVVTYRFRWTSFAAVDGDSIRAGDALAGFFLDDRTSLRVTWPGEYAATEVVPAPDQSGDGEAVWRGPREFGDDEPTVVVAPEVTSTEAGTGPSGTRLGIGHALLVGAVLLGSAVAVWRRRGGRRGPGPADSHGGEMAVEAPDADGEDESASEDGPPPELLSNEERVLRLLEANDGRMKQQAVADRLGWTAAKTSQVVGDMRDADAVETFRLGRENVVTLPDRGLGDDLGPDDSI